ncbi:MAG: hypothetical protein RI926_278 [Actinomycetota bacterium]
MTKSSPTISFHPDLKMGKWFPRVPVNKLTLPLFRAKLKPKTSTPRVDISEVEVTTRGGVRRARFFRPAGNSADLPLVYWRHGGGMVGGNPVADDTQSIRIVEKLGIAVVNMSYRFAPEHPAPAAIDDVEDGYLHFVENASTLGVDPKKIVIAGASAGGGLTALLAQRLRHRDLPQPKLQVLIYPMLDDRTTLQTIKFKNMRAWYPESNRWAWRAFLRAEPGSDQVRADFVPAREINLTGLPPTWIGVGNLDLFEGEDREYARRLSDAGIPCELVIIEGAFHGFDIVLRDAPVSREFLNTWLMATKKALQL